MLLATFSYFFLDIHLWSLLEKRPWADTVHSSLTLSERMCPISKMLCLRALASANLYPSKVLESSNVSLSCNQAKFHVQVQQLLCEYWEKNNTHACTDALVTERTWLSILVFAYFQDFCLMTTWSYSGIWQTALTELPARTWPLYHQHVNAAACDSFFCGLLQHSYLLTSIHNFSLCKWFSVESKITRQIPIAQPAQRDVWTSGLEQILI